MVITEYVKQQATTDETFHVTMKNALKGAPAFPSIPSMTCKTYQFL